MKISKRAAAGSMLAAFLIIPSLSSAGMGNAGKPAGAPVKTPFFTNVSVHDPSVIEADDQYYVFGSHLAAAKTKDLMNWTAVANGVYDGNPLIPNVSEELKETLEWAQTDTLWAADVIQLKDGKYYMYYNACKGDSPRSALGIAVSDSIEGPYEDTGIILKSGMWGEKSEDGTVYDAAIHPNAVDPDVFFDKDGKLWMMYGSYSGGIFVLEMDGETGKPIPGQGYGKKITGGNHSRIEGPAVMYSPETNYYYLFLSFGGLDASGGYNIRVARSKTPDGPYYDAAGNDMINVKADPSLPLFDDASIEPYGVKLMGTSLFEKKVGDPGEEPGIGYVSPGHNTAVYDEETGRHYLIFHSRFPERGEEHEVRVHQMHMTADAWPAVAPSRNTNETTGKINMNEMAGDYQFINHGKSISAELNESKQIELKENGQISGAVTGTWEKGKSNQVIMQMGGESFEGVFLKQWDEAASAYETTFTALSKNGEAIWGNRMADQTNKEVVEAVKADLEIGHTDAVFQHMDLPAEGTRNSSITWSSSHPDIIQPDGTVTRPEAGEGDAAVVLEAVIRSGKASATKVFQVTVMQQSAGDRISRYSFDNAGQTTAVDASGNGMNGTLNGGARQTEEGTLDLNGTDGYMELPALTADAQDFTFSSRVYWRGGGVWQRIFDIGKSNSQNMFFTPSDGSGALRFTIHDGHDQNISADAPLAQNEWVHVALTLEGETGKLYVNGELAGTNPAVTFDPSQILGSMNYIGKSRYGADPMFNGQMDEIQFYRKALTAAEIKDLAAQ